MIIRCLLCRTLKRVCVLVKACSLDDLWGMVMLVPRYAKSPLARSGSVTPESSNSFLSLMLPGTDRDTCLIFPLVSTTIWVLMVSAFFFPEYHEPVSLRSVLCSVASTTNFRISSSLKSVFSVGISKTDSTTGRTLAKYLQIALSWMSNNAERNTWVVYDLV